MRLALDGRPRLEGNVYLPLSVAKLRGGARWLASLSTDPFFDVDLNLEAIDLAELATAVKTKPDMSGQAGGKIQLSGTPASLQGNGEIHLHDFVLDGAPGLMTDVETRLALGMANFKATLNARGSDPVKVEGTLPLKLEKRDAEYAASSNGPVSATLNFPAIILAKLPRYLSPAIFKRGILSGNITIADSVQHPLVTGTANLIDGQLLRGSTVSVGLILKGRNAAIDFVHLREQRPNFSYEGWVPPWLDVSARGELDFANPDDARLRLFPTAAVFATALTAGDCVSRIEFFAGVPGIMPSRQVQEFAFSGSVFTQSFTLSFPSANDVDPPDEFPFCRDGATLTLQISPAFTP